MTTKTMQELNKIEEELKVIILESEKELEVYLKEIEVAKKSEAEAVKAVIKAKKGSNAEAFAKANQDLNNAKDIATFYVEKITEMKELPYITKEQHAEYSARIKKQLDALNHVKKVRAGKILEELKEIQEEVWPVIKKGQSMLYEIQHNMLKDHAELVTANGTKVHMANLEDKYEDYSLMHGIEFITRQNPSQMLMEYIEKGEDK